MSDPNTTPPVDARAISTSRAPLIAREPVLTTNLLAALVLEACVLLRAFGVRLTDDQQYAINGFVAILVTIGAAVIARRFTTPLVAPRNNLGEPLASQHRHTEGTPPTGGSPTSG